MPAAVGSMTSRPVWPSVIRSVLPPIPETTQGRAVAMASRSELLIPSATLGKQKCRRPASNRPDCRRRRRTERGRRSPVMPASSVSRWRSLPGPTKIRLAGARRATSVQASSKSGRFF